MCECERGGGGGTGRGVVEQYANFNSRIFHAFLCVPTSISVMLLDFI